MRPLYLTRPRELSKEYVCLADCCFVISVRAGIKIRCPVGASFCASVPPPAPVPTIIMSYCLSSIITIYFHTSFLDKLLPDIDQKKQHNPDDIYKVPKERSCCDAILAAFIVVWEERAT